jgi:H+/Cl- antiporter ClcA
MAPSPQPNIFANDAGGTLSLRFWGLIVVVGIGTGLGGGLLMKLLRATQHLSWSYSGATFLAAVQRDSGLRRIVVLIAAGLVVAIVRWLLQRGATGGHSGELTEAIWFRSGHVAEGKTLVRAALSIVIVGMGASLGREAAPKQTGAAIASALSRWVGLSPAESRLLAACGAGAGMAAVYNVPLGGALFAIEVLLGTLALPLVVPAFAASLIATATSWLMLPMVPSYQVPSYRLSLPLALGALVAGPVLGLASVAYVRLIAWADRRKGEGWTMWIAPVVVFAVLGALAIPFPQLLGNGKDVVQQNFIAPGGIGLLLALVVLKPLVTAACLGSGAPGGLFTPSMTYGALIGSVLGEAWARVWPGAPLGSCALVASTAVLAATTQGPVSAIVLVLELTRHVDAIMVPIMLAVAGAVGCARLIDVRSVYSARVHAGRAAAKPVAPADAPASRLVSTDYAVISASAPYAEVAHALLATKAPALYVVDETGALLGAITPARALELPPDGQPLATVTAADLSRPVPAIEAGGAEDAIAQRLAASGAAEMPVVEVPGCRLVGLARAPVRSAVTQGP